MRAGQENLETLNRPVGHDLRARSGYETFQFVNMVRGARLGQTGHSDREAVWLAGGWVGVGVGGRLGSSGWPAALAD